MTADDAPHEVATEDAASGVGWRSIAVLASVVLSVLVLYGIGVLLPYFANGLHRLPLADLASGAHEPYEVWPENAWGLPITLARLVGGTFGPFVAATAVGVGSAWVALLWRRPGPQRMVKSLAVLAVVAVSVAALLFLVSATGTKLAVWWWD